MNGFMLMPHRPRTNLERQRAFCARHPGYYARLKRRRKQTQAFAFADTAAKKSVGTAITATVVVPVVDDCAAPTAC
jgi:hypothetical protein